MKPTAAAQPYNFLQCVNDVTLACNCITPMAVVCSNFVQRNFSVNTKIISHENDKNIFSSRPTCYDGRFL